MQHLFKNVGVKQAAGTNIPIHLDTFRRLGVELRQGELSLVAGQPGAGKSALALSLALHAHVPTLYVCADTTELTMRVRTLAMLSGKEQRDCEVRMYEDTQWAQDLFNSTRNISWSFDSSPSLETLDEELLMYEELFGLPPQLIIVDNLIDVTTNSNDEWASIRATMKYLKEVAMKTSSAVLVLHHTSEAQETKGYGPARSSIQGKVAQLPSLILTVEPQPMYSRLGVAVVKNRYGNADTSGNYGDHVDWVPSTMQISDIVEENSAGKFSELEPF